MIKTTAIAARDAVLFHPIVIRIIDRMLRRRGVVTSRGCEFDVSSALVSPWVKALLFWEFYEKSEVLFVEKYLPASGDVVELGGSIGVVTSHIARRVAEGGRVVSVEADRRLVPVLKENVRRNAPFANVTVINAAVDYSGEPTIHLRFGDSNLSGGVAPEGSLFGENVPTTTLSRLIAEHGIGDFTLVSDIEGAEQAMAGADAEGFSACNLAIVELHDAETNGTRPTVELFRAIGFEVVDRRKEVYVFRRIGLKAPQ